MAALLAILGLVARTRLTLREIDLESPTPCCCGPSHGVGPQGAVMREVRLAAADRQVDETEGLRVIEDENAWVLVSPDPGRHS